MTDYSRLDRTQSSEDQDGGRIYVKNTDDIVPWSWNWKNLLASGETVASAAYTDSGVTRTAEALASPVTSCNVTGLGEFECVITTSTGRKFSNVFRFWAPQGGREYDYKP